VRYRRLGRTGAQVSEVGFGGWAIGGDRFGYSYGPTEDGESLRAIARARQGGCTFFETADVYGRGHSEALLGRALGGERAGVILATAVGSDFLRGAAQDFSPAFVERAVERSLGRLGTDYLDLLLLHFPPRAVAGTPETYDGLERLRRAGKVRWIGVSALDPAEAAPAVATGRVDAVQVPYSALDQRAAGLLDLAEERGVGVVAAAPLAEGFLAVPPGTSPRFPASDRRARWSRATVAARAAAAAAAWGILEREAKTPVRGALRFALGHPVVASAAAGARTVAEVEEALAAGDDPPLSPAVLEALAALAGARGFG
jgi:aryl-alcohol dehydrogenase-like predicted oxidoreductase